MLAKSIETRHAVWNYVDQGEGHVVLLVHGFPLDHSMWQYQIAELSKSCRIICPDLPGFGLSKTSRSPSMEGLADDLSDLLTVLQVTEPITFCGLSMGGYIGWQFWRNHTVRLARLVQCDTRSISDSPEVARARRINAMGVVDKGSESIASGMVSNIFWAQTIERKPELVSRIKSVIARTSPHSVAGALNAMADRPDASAWLSQIEIPVLLAAGTHDTISTPFEMQAIADQIPDGRFVEIEGAGHVAPLENPVEFNEQLLEFLRPELETAAN